MKLTKEEKKVYRKYGARNPDAGKLTEQYGPGTLEEYR